MYTERNATNLLLHSFTPAHIGYNYYLLSSAFALGPKSLLSQYIPCGTVHVSQLLRTSDISIRLSTFTRANQYFVGSRKQ